MAERIRGTLSLAVRHQVRQIFPGNQGSLEPRVARQRPAQKVIPKRFRKISAPQAISDPLERDRAVTAAAEALGPKDRAAWRRWRRERAHEAIVAASPNLLTPPRPFATGIHHQLRADLPHILASDISAVLARHAQSPEYLETLKPGAQRFDLAGHPAGFVD